MSTVRIICRVFPGLFENEYYVMVNGSSAYYVNRDNVTTKGTPTADQPVDGAVLGYSVETEGGKTLVQLPGEVVVGGSRTWVESDLVSAA